MKRLIFWFWAGLMLAAQVVQAQSTLVPLNPDAYHLFDRYEILQGKWAPGFHSSFKGYERKGVAQLADSLLADSSLRLSRADRYNLAWVRQDNREWTDSVPKSKRQWLGPLYRYPGDAVAFHNDWFDFHGNMALHFSGGRDSDSPGSPSINTRGLEVRGMVDQKVGFYALITENQAFFPEYVHARTQAEGVLPGEGFWKRFGSRGYDFFHARGYITAQPTKHIAVQFGHDRNFIGNGYRSMILSDYAAPYTFLKLQTRVWRFQYTNLYTAMKTEPLFTSTGINGSQLVPTKYTATHHLSINLLDNLNIGFFESIVFHRSDSLGGGGYDLNYLNPILFYRAVEQYNGSPDNVLVGMDAKWTLWKRIQVYGQLNLDEFLLKEIRAGRGWWGNKQAGQVGVKYIRAFGIPNLDLQAEYNVARPYTYSHLDGRWNYAHYGQPLAHPLGANFREFIGIARYQPWGFLSLTGKAFYAIYGEDRDGINFGGNILRSYDAVKQNAAREYGNTIGQGVQSRQVFLDFTITWQVRHNLFLDMKQVVRVKSSDIAARDRTTQFTSLSLRFNLPQRLAEF